MNLFTLFAVFLFFAVPTVPVQHQPRSQQRASKSQSDAKHTDSPSAPITDNQTTSYYQQQAPDKPHGWHKFFAWPDGITALAIVLTLGAIVWQAVLTRKSVGIAKESILLQETAYKQWVEFKNWGTTISEDGNSLKVKVDLINSTNFPLTLDLVKITLGLTMGTEAYLTCKGRSLYPAEPVEMSVDFGLTELQKPNFFEGCLGIFITGEVAFRSILDRREVQRFEGLLECGPKNTTFHYTIPSQSTT